MDCEKLLIEYIEFLDSKWTKNEEGIVVTYEFKVGDKEIKSKYVYTIEGKFAIANHENFSNDTGPLELNVKNFCYSLTPSGIWDDKERELLFKRRIKLKEI